MSKRSHRIKCPHKDCGWSGMTREDFAQHIQDKHVSRMRIPPNRLPLIGEADHV